MFSYSKKLQYPVKIDKPNPRLANIIISQYGGPDGELGASLRYLSQRYSMPFDDLKGLLTDIGTSATFWHPLEKSLRCNGFSVDKIWAYVSKSTETEKAVWETRPPLLFYCPLNVLCICTCSCNYQARPS